jgi:hypothetical protein
MIGVSNYLNNGGYVAALIILISENAALVKPINYQIAKGERIKRCISISRHFKIAIVGHIS